jgi:hypothetical protein
MTLLPMKKVAYQKTDVKTAVELAILKDLYEFCVPFW